MAEMAVSPSVQRPLFQVVELPPSPSP
ncbi:hypothetical protein A2U01_0087173, partial [Trifolium medium]|nr:hypothetical protein [Trifolium medium]